MRYIPPSPTTIPLLAVCRVAFALVIGGTCAQFMRAAESKTAETAKSPIVYRRVFVPADNVDFWPRDGEKYIPVEARDFEAWIAAANKAEAAHASTVAIDAAEYTARLEFDGQLAGRGQWRI
jgi:hypothetical protein